MTATAEAQPKTNLPAVVRTPQDRAAMDKRIDAGVAEARAQNTMVAQIRGTQWGLGIDSRVAKAVANYCRENGIDPVRHVEVLGGRIYLTAEFYQERGAPLLRSGQVIPAEPEFINVDPRLDELIAGDDKDAAAWARTEKSRRAKARIEHNAPEAAISTCVQRFTIAATGQTIVGVNWCGGGVRKKRIRNRDTGQMMEIDADPIGDLEPTKTSITRAARRAWKQVADVIVDYGRQVKPLEQRAEIISAEIEQIPAKTGESESDAEGAESDPPETEAAGAPPAQPPAAAKAGADAGDDELPFEIAGPTT